MSQLTLLRIDRLRYRPSKRAEDFLEVLRRTVVGGEKFRVARLAIARSLIEDTPVHLRERASQVGSPIEGTHLFGDHSALWACLVCAATEPPISEDLFRALVESHWDRGADLLEGDYRANGNNDVDFALSLWRLASKRGVRAGSEAIGGSARDAYEFSGNIAIRVGELSIDTQTNRSFSLDLNAPGYSPHLAIMGKTRSGKTRTGLAIMRQLVSQTNVPLLLIDPKGEFVRDGALLPKPEWSGDTLERFVPGIEALDVPAQPVPLDFLYLPADATDHDRAASAISFKDSFQKCLRAKGDVALDALRQAVQTLLLAREERITLERIHAALENYNEETGRRPGGIEAKLNELTSLNTFVPQMSPALFFARRWVIGLGGASEEVRRLIMFLILDSLLRYLTSLADSSVTPDGYRAIRHMLVIDEAKEILAYRHDALSQLIRKSAAKGGVVMLLSQSPEDFDQEADDFLSQMGTIAVFASSANSVRNLRAAFGIKVTPEEFSDRRLTKGIALVKIPDRQPFRLIAWE